MQNSGLSCNSHSLAGWICRTSQHVAGHSNQPRDACWIHWEIGIFFSPFPGSIRFQNPVTETPHLKSSTMYPLNNYCKNSSRNKFEMGQWGRVDRLVMVGLLDSLHRLDCRCVVFSSWHGPWEINRWIPCAAADDLCWCPGRKNAQDDQRFGGREVLWIRTGSVADGDGYIP